MQNRKQVINEYKDLARRVEILMSKKEKLQKELEVEKEGILEKQELFGSLDPKRKQQQEIYRTENYKRAAAQKSLDEIYDSAMPLIQKRDAAREKDEKVLRPYRRQLERAQRAYSRAEERIKQAQQRHDNAKSMEGYAAISAVVDTVTAFGGDSTTKTSRQLRSRFSQGNYTDASNASAARALELEDAEESLILAREDLEDAQEEFDERQAILFNSRRQLEEEAEKAEQAVHGYMAQMMDADRAIARAEFSIDGLDELASQTHLLEDAQTCADNLSISLDETGQKLLRAHEELEALRYPATIAMKKLRNQRIVIVIVLCTALIALLLWQKPFLESNMISNAAQPVAPKDSSGERDYSGLGVSGIEEKYKIASTLSQFYEFPDMSIDAPDALDRSIQRINEETVALGDPALIKRKSGDTFSITLDNILGDLSLDEEQMEAYLGLVGITSNNMTSYNADIPAIGAPTATGTYSSTSTDTLFYKIKPSNADVLITVSRSPLED